jgi:hypothetical protein
MIATNSALPESGQSKESVLQAEFLDVLIWRRALELNPEVKGPGQRVIICSRFLTKLVLILST